MRSAKLVHRYLEQAVHCADWEDTLANRLAAAKEAKDLAEELVMIYTAMLAKKKTETG